MAKKIILEVDAETSKAKRKLEELATSGGGTAGADNVAASANRAAKALDATAKNVQSLGREAAGSSAQMRTLFRSFAGLGASMAAGYAANYMSPGVGKTSMGYLSSMAAGASTGAAIGSFIPGVGTVVGAGVGAVAGAAGEYLKNDKSEKDWFNEFAEGEQSRKEQLGWNEMFKELTTVKTSFKGLKGLDELEAQLKSVEEASTRTSATIEELKKAEAAYLSSIERLKPDRFGQLPDDGLTAEQRIQRATEEAKGLALTRTKLSQTEGASERFAKMIESLKERIVEFEAPPEARTSIEAFDSLARVGGNFAGSDAGFRDLQRINEKQVAILEKIEAKAGKGRGTF